MTIPPISASPTAPTAPLAPRPAVRRPPLRPAARRCLRLPGEHDDLPEIGLPQRLDGLPGVGANRVGEAEDGDRFAFFVPQNDRRLAGLSEIRPAAPLPGNDLKPVTAERTSPRFSAAERMAYASGCSDRRSSAPARASAPPPDAPPAAGGRRGGRAPAGAPTVAPAPRPGPAPRPRPPRRAPARGRGPAVPR